MSNREQLSDYMYKIEKNNLAILLKSVNEIQARLNADPSNFALQHQLSKVMAQVDESRAKLGIKIQYDKETHFESSRKAVDYLKSLGLKCNLNKFYIDLKKGLIKREEDDTYLKVSLDEYAKTLQKKKNFTFAGSKAQKEAEDREARKSEAEIRLKEAQAKIAEHKLEIQQGKYLLKTDVWLELAARAVAFRNTLKNTFESRVMELVKMVEDRSSIEDISIWINNIIDYSLSEFSGPINISADFNGALEQEIKDDNSNEDL